MKMDYKIRSERNFFFIFTCLMLVFPKMLMMMMAQCLNEENFICSRNDNYNDNFFLERNTLSEKIVPEKKNFFFV